MNEASSVLHMENPKAKDWLERHHNNRRWLRTFPDFVNGDAGDIREDINWSVGYGLELIAAKENEQQ
jgi:hypothetical protein